MDGRRIGNWRFAVRVGCSLRRGLGLWLWVREKGGRGVGECCFRVCGERDDAGMRAGGWDRVGR